MTRAAAILIAVGLAAVFALSFWLGYARLPVAPRPATAPAAGRLPGLDAQTLAVIAARDPQFSVEFAALGQAAAQARARLAEAFAGPPDAPRVAQAIRDWSAVRSALEQRVLACLLAVHAELTAEQRHALLDLAAAVPVSAGP